MRVEKIPVLELDILSNIMTDYINNEKSISDLYKYKIDINTFKQIIKDKSKQNINRGILKNELLNQYENIENNSLVINNINLLEDDKTFTITTAHQLCLFTGPLYFIYKTISTIKLCIQLKDNYPEYNFVPIFWLGSEDHDFEEINHLNIFNKKIVWDNNEKGAVGKMSNKNIKKTLDNIFQLLLNNNNNFFISKIYNIFKTEENYSKSFIKFLHFLFGQYGLVVLEQDNATLKKLFSKQFEEELSSKIVINNIQKELHLIGEKYKIQAKPRDINIFYMTKGLRERIIKDNDKYIVNNTKISFSKKSILEELKNHPERFSPNVLLRPLYQEFILPNLAYIGGGGEIAYWLQLQSLFNSQQVNFPMLILRDMGLIIPPKTNKNISKIPIDKKCLFLNKELLISKLIKSNSSKDISIKNETNTLNNIYKLLLKKALIIDKNLEKTILGEKKKSLNSLKNIEAKMLRAEKRNNELLVQRITKIKESLFPNNKLQERHTNFFQFYFNSEENFFDELLKEFDPLKSEMKIFTQ